MILTLLSLKDPYAASVAAWSTTSMSKFPDLLKSKLFQFLIGLIHRKINRQLPLDLVEMQMLEEEESSMGWIWMILGIVFVVIILAVGGVRRQLKSATAEASGEDFDEHMSYSEELKAMGLVE